MISHSIHIVIFLLTFTNHWIDPGKQGSTESTENYMQDDPQKLQLVLNGRLWRNQYGRVKGDQFFLLNQFTKGSVTFNGRSFSDLMIKYDNFNDELLLWYGSHPIVFLNKELVKDFTLNILGRSYYFFNAGTDTTSVLKGYINLIYDGPSELYVKYYKEIQPLAVDNKYDLFYQVHRVYMKKDSTVVPIYGRRSLLGYFPDRKKELRSYINTHRLMVLRRDPYSFIPVLEYYDTKKED